MTDTPKPSFKALWLEYLDAFNRHSLVDVFSHLSPQIALMYRGDIIHQGDRAASEKEYLEHWALPNARASVIGEVEEVEDGVKVLVADHARNKKMNIRYVYALEGDKWLHVRHEIDDYVDLVEA